MLIFRRTILLTQHRVSSLPLGDCSVHRLREESRGSGSAFTQIPHTTNRQSRYITPARLKSACTRIPHTTNRQSRYITPARLKSACTQIPHTTNSQSRYITPARLKSAYTRIPHTTNRQSRYITPTRLKSACTRIPHHQQPIPLHNTNTPQVSTIQPTQQRTK